MISGAPVPAVITSVRPLTDDTTLFALKTVDRVHGSSPRPAVSSFLPGQFLQLSLPGAGEVPISYCGIPKHDETIELCIRHAGHVTGPLRYARPGDRTGVRGPCGRGFPLDDYVGQDLLLIAGGLGMAPLRSLLLALLADRDRWGRLTLLYGARVPASLLFLDELLGLASHRDIQIHLAVDRPGYCLYGPPDCHVALLPDLLEHLRINPECTFAALCGPPVVYPHLISRLKRLGMEDNRIHLSLERRMKCGIGRCGHCGVGTSLCCMDGPVFSYQQIASIDEALS